MSLDVLNGSPYRPTRGTPAGCFECIGVVARLDEEERRCERRRGDLRDDHGKCEQWQDGRGKGACEFEREREQGRYDDGDVADDAQNPHAATTTSPC